MGDNESEIKFYDNDDSSGEESKESYETIVLRQISACVTVLSKPQFKLIDNKNYESYEDIREQIINSVDTLRMLMNPFLRDKDEVILLTNETEGYIDEFSNKKIIENGKEIKIKESKTFNQDSLYWNEIINYKVKQSRKMFEALLRAYNKYKYYIHSLEME
jgi:hypothetical protein